MATTTQRTYGNYASPPGDLLAEELAARGLSQTEFARRIGCSRQTITALIHGRCPLPPAMAEAIGAGLGTGAQIWDGLEDRYQHYKASLAVQLR